MSWVLMVLDDNGNVAAAYDYQGGQVRGGFTWERDPHGDSKQMKFRANPKNLPAITYGSALLLSVGSVNEFFGYVEEMPNPRDAREGEYVVIGASEKFKKAVFYRAYNISIDAQTLLYDALYAQGGIKYPNNIVFDPSLIPAPGMLQLPKQSFYNVTYAELFDSLAKRMGYVWGVRPTDRKFYFLPYTSATNSVSYAEGNLKWQPIKTKDLVTSARASFTLEATPSLPAFELIVPDTGGYFLGGAKPNIYTVDHALHPIFLAQKTFPLPQGFNPLSPRAFTSVFANNFTNLGNLSDGDPSTYASNTAGTALTLDFYDNAGANVAYEKNTIVSLVFSLDLEIVDATALDVILVTAWQRYAEVSNPLYVYLTHKKVFEIAPDVGRRNVNLILPIHTLFSSDGKEIASYAVNTEVKVDIRRTDNNFSADQVRVYGASFLGPDGLKLAPLLQSVLTPPYLEPATMRLQRRLNPTPGVVVTDVPGGNINTQAQLYRYLYTPEDATYSPTGPTITTEVVIGDTDSSREARGIALTAKQFAEIVQRTLQWNLDLGRQ